MGLYWFNGDAGGQVLNYFSNPLAPPALTNPLFGDTQGYVNTSSIAAYADWTFDLTDQLKLDVGARYTTLIDERPTTFRATVQNVFDQAYWSGVASYGAFSQGSPRTLLLSATVDF